MGNQYHNSLVEAVGSAFYYYTNRKDFDLINSQVDFESFANGWIKKYHGDWDAFSNSQPLMHNTFKPCVDQLVYRIMRATEDEIERRITEIIKKMNTTKEL